MNVGDSVQVDHPAAGVWRVKVVGPSLGTGMEVVNSEEDAMRSMGRYLARMAQVPQSPAPPTE